MTKTIIQLFKNISTDNRKLFSINFFGGLWKYDLELKVLQTTIYI